ncbi:type IV secretion system protein virB4 [Pseudomonas chlororaphis subsp. aurantiaca]|nr:type IV secretion system protein virB4 [Pseudomonas chlororaphis subsp. aurantiaca]
MGLGSAAGHHARTPFGVLALLGRQPQAIAQEPLHQHDHLAAIQRPLAGFAEGQGDVVIVAALAAAYAGKTSIH